MKPLRTFSFVSAAFAALALAPAARQRPDLDGVGFDRGTPQAAVNVVEFGDFGCSACAQFAHAVLPAIDAEFVQAGKVRWKFVPFVLGAFRNSRAATAAALCAADQGAFWPMHDGLYREQNAWSAARDPRPVVMALAHAAGVEPEAFRRCVEDPATQDWIREYNRLAKRLSVRATPTFFVGNRRIRGALPLDLFRTVLLEAAQP